MSLTPHWSDFQERLPSAHLTMQRFAGFVYEHVQERVPRSELDGLDLEVGFRNQLLTDHGDTVSVTDPEILAEYLIRHGAGLADAAWDDPETFTELLLDLQHRSARLNLRREVGAGVVLVLVQEYRKNVLERLLAMVTPKQGAQEWSFWMTYSLLCQVLPELDVDAELLAAELGPVLDAVAGDLAGGEIYRAVERLAGRSEQTALELYRAFSMRSDSPVCALAVNALAALSRFDLAEAHQRALTLTSVEAPVLRRVGVAALGQLDYAGDATDALKASTQERFRALLGAPESGTDYTLARAYGELLDKGVDAASALVELSTRPDPMVQHQVAFVLMGKADACSAEPWFRQCLFNLVSVSSSHTETLRYLDHCASRFVSHDPDAVGRLAEAVTLARSYGREGEDATLPEMFRTSLDALCEAHPEVLAAAITRWYASADRRLHRAATDLVQHRGWRAGEESRRDWLLSKPVLDSLDEREVIHTVERVMGWVIVGRTLASLLVSALQREPCSSAISEFIESALWEPVLYNYPGGAGEYLTERLESGCASATEAGVLRAALNRQAEYTASRHLPVPAELRPTAQRVYLLRLAQQKYQSRAIEKEQSKSVFLSLVNRVSLKYGRASFSEVDGVLTPPSELFTYSHEVELPRGELIDPLGQAHDRLRWQSSGMDARNPGAAESNVEERA